jgi:BNR/Asp-box repeat
MKANVVGCLLIVSIAIGAGPVPLSAATWVNVTGNLANMASECGNLTLLSAVPGSNTVIAGIALDGLWANSAGTTWAHLGSGAGSDTITNRPFWIVYDPVHAGVFWEAGIYNGGGVYQTIDNGVTFQRLGSISHNDYVSVDFSDPNRQTLLAGGHEQSQTVYRSTDGGKTWTNIGVNIPADTKFSTSPVIIDAQTYVVNLSGYAGSVAGILRTTNGGASWQQVSTLEPGGAPPLVTSNGTIYWSYWNSLLKSTDSGSTWSQVGSNLQPVRPVELPDGRLLSLGATSLVISADAGSTWTPIGDALPFTPAGVIYSPGRKAVFVWRWDCGGVVLPDAIMRLDVDFVGLAAPTGLRIKLD